MKIYGASIYGAARSPYKTEPEWGFFTKKEGKLFVHIFSWPKNRILSIPALKNSIGKIYLIQNPGKALGYTIEDGKIKVSLPENAPNKINSVVVIEVEGLPEAAVM